MEESLKIFFCEDDENLGMLLREYLQAKGYVTDLFSDGEAGFKGFTKTKYDLCVLDVMMPKKDGFTLAQEIRSINLDIPIIFLTAKTLKEDILEGFKIGADDYLTKPFVTGELLARVRALTRRKGEIIDENKIGYNGLQLNKKTCSVIWKDSDVKLSLKEYQIMELLIMNPRQILPKERIIEKIWGYESDVEYNNIEVYISFLRKKLSVISAPVQIKTARGIGYSLE